MSTETKCRHCGRHLIPATEQPNGSTWRHNTTGLRYCNGYPDSKLGEPEPTPDEQELTA